MTDIGRRGSVRQARNGTWYFVVDASYPGASRRQTRRRGFPSRRAAQSGLTALLNDLGNHQYVAPTRLTLTEFVETRFLPVLAGEVRPSTFDSYARNLRLHVLPELGRVQLQALDAGALTACYQRLARSGRKDQAAGKRLSPRSVRYIHTIVRRALEMALEWDLVSRNVADRAKAPKPAATAARHEFPTWPRQVLSEFLQWEREDRLYALWLLFATTGMRRGEALGLSWAAVDLDHRRLSVRRTLVGLEGGLPVWSDPKTARGRRVVALDAATVGALRSHRVRQVHERLSSGSAYVDHGLVFCWEDGRPFHPERLSRTFTRHVARHGLPAIRLHDLRHTWATLALESGVHPKVVSERLGHASIAITLDIYSHVSPAMQTDAADRVASLFVT